MIEDSIRRDEVAVIVDPEGSPAAARHDWQGAEVAAFDAGGTAGDDARGVAEAVGAALEAKPSALVVDGDDRLVSAVVTAMRRRAPGERPAGDAPALLPLATGDYQTVAGLLGGPRTTVGLPGKLLRALRKGYWTRARLPTVRVLASCEPAPLWGFSFGAGILFTLFEAHHRSGGRGLSGLGGTVSRLAREFATSGGERLQARSGRMTVDWEPWGESIGYVVASGLTKTWLGLQPGDGEEARWLGDPAGGDFLRKVAGSRAVPRFLRGAQGEAFERIHIDWSGGFVLDGELYDPGVPYVLEVTDGGSVECLSL